MFKRYSFALGAFMLLYVECVIGQPSFLKLNVKKDTLSIALEKGLCRDGQEIHIGDEVPDREFKVVNYSKPYIKLSDLRGKWLILDFWSSGCGSCIAAMPMLERLQQHFGNQVNILPINFQSASTAAQILKTVATAIGSGVTIPSVAEDTTSYSLFSTYVNPMEAWIDPQGKLAAITDLEYVTEENIQAAIDGKPIRFSVYSLKYSRSIGQGRGTGDTISYGSVIREQEGANYFARMLTASPDAQLAVEIGHISGLYNDAYRNSGSEKMAQIEKEMNGDILKRIVSNFNVNVGDSTYLPGSYTAKNSKNADIYKSYIYEMTAPPGISREEMGEKMLSDLDLYFNVRSSIEKRKVKTLSLVKLKGFTEVPATVENDGLIFNGALKFNNGYISDYLRQFNAEHGNYYTMTPLIIYDKTGIKQKIHLPVELKFPMTLEDLRKQLQAYHLDIVPGEDKEMDMLVLMKKDQSIIKIQVRQIIN